MGRWEGRYTTDGSETGPFVAHVVPQGGGSYRIWVRMGEHGSRYEIRGTRKINKLLFQGRFQASAGTDEAAYDLSGEMSEQSFKGKFESPEVSGTIELTRVRNDAPPARTRPAGAIRLLDGAGLNEWQGPAGRPTGWQLQPDGSVEAAGGDLISRRGFGGFQLHIEFRLPLMAETRGQQRANSGVVLAGRYEVHILDTFGGDPAKDSCGAIYGIEAPREEASFPPLEWQTFDITLEAPETDSVGRTTRRALLTVVLNGVTIHERRALEDFREALLRLRWAGSAVRFRNIWILPQ